MTAHDNRFNGAMFFVSGGLVGQFTGPDGVSTYRVKYDTAAGELGVEDSLGAPCGYMAIALPVDKKPTSGDLTWLDAHSGEVLRQPVVLYAAAHPVHGQYVQIRRGAVSLGDKYAALRAAAQ